MVSQQSGGFRLTVLNPGGRDPEQSFADGAGKTGDQHAPVNFHAFAACTAGSFRRDPKRALAQHTPVLLLIRGDFKASQRGLADLKKNGRTVAVSLKETGLHQIAQQLRDPNRLTRLTTILAAADGCLATTPEVAAVYRSLLRNSDSKHVAFIPTPYPIEDPQWNFSRPANERSGVFVGTREWDVPTRNHLAALLLARQIGERTDEMITVFNGDGRTGAKLLAALEFRTKRLRVIDRRLSYADYLREVSRHKILLQLDTSFVPGQVAGDALLCRLPCIGGNGAIDRIAFKDTCGFGRSMEEIERIAMRLLREPAYYEQVVADAQGRASEFLSFARIARGLEEFFNRLGQ
jgi:hypothetical protein